VLTGSRCGDAVPHVDIPRLIRLNEAGRLSFDGLITQRTQIERRVDIVERELMTEVVIFGNANGGTPLMQSTQTVGIDLPLKALVWQDAAGSTWLSYNNPTWLAQRHGLGHEVEATITAMTTMLGALAKAATAAP
jgi:hypothetical protein